MPESKPSMIKKDDPKLVFACIAMGVLGFALFMGMPIVAEAMHSELGFGDDLIGYMASAEYGGMFIASVIASFLINKMDRRLLAGVGIVIAIVSGVASLYFHDFNTLLPLRLLSGIGSGLGYSVAVAIMAGTHDTAKNFTYFVVTQVVSNSIILYTFPSLSESWGLNGIYAAYIFIFASGLLTLFWLPHTAEEVTGEKIENTSDVLHGLPMFLPLLCLVGIFGFYSMLGSYWTYVYLIGIDLGIEANIVDNSMAALTILSLFGSWLALVFARKFGQFKPFLGALIALELILISNTFGITGTTYFLSMIGIFLFWNFIDIYQLGTIGEIDPSGRFGAMIPGAQGLAMAISPAVAGYLLGEDGDYLIVMWMLAGLVIISVVAYSIVFAVFRKSANAKQQPLALEVETANLN